LASGPKTSPNTRIIKVFGGRADGGLAAIVAACWLAACATAPPVQEMSDARQAIAAAEQANAEGLAPESWNEARQYLMEAEDQIRQQAYGPARVNAVRAKNRAVQALETSQRASEGQKRD
jgi:hypothetical protein